MISPKRIAILLTCHNRRETTLLCLEALFTISIPPEFSFNVFLVDDGSTDGTGEAVKKRYPLVNIISGDGSLYWNQGMRLSWTTASNTADFDFYMWLNDDTVLSENALIELLYCFDEAYDETGKPAIITGACQEAIDTPEFSYGGRTDSGPVIPNDELQLCKYTNGNVLLVSKEIFKVLGNLSPDYTHGMGDFDYGLRAAREGFNCYTTRVYIAICTDDSGIPVWCNPKMPISKRWKFLHSPNGLNIREYNTFRKKFWRWKWIIYALKAYLKMIFPKFYAKITSMVSLIILIELHWESIIR